MDDYEDVFNKIYRSDRVHFPDNRGQNKLPRTSSPEYERVERTDSENVIQDSQPSMASQGDIGFYERNFQHRMHKKTSSRGSVSAVCRHRRSRKSGVMKTIRARNTQKFGVVYKSVLTSRPRHLKSPPQYSKIHDFERQLLNLSDAPPIYEDVIPTTPERPPHQFSNTVKRHTTVIAIVKRQKVIQHTTRDIADDTRHNETNNNVQREETGLESHSSLPLKQLQIKLVDVNIKQSASMPRLGKNDLKLISNKAPQQEDCRIPDAQDSESTTERIPKIKIVKSRIPKKQTKPHNQIDSDVDQEIFNVKNKSTANTNTKNLEEEMDSYRVVDENSQPEDLDIMKVKITRPKIKFNKEQRNMIKQLMKKGMKPKKQVVVQETQYPVYTQQQQSEIQVSAEHKKAGGVRDETPHKANVDNRGEFGECSEILVKEKERNIDTNINEKKTVVQTARKVRRPTKRKVVAVNEDTVEAESRNTSPAKRPRRKVVKSIVNDEESDEELSKMRKRSPRKVVKPLTSYKEPEESDPEMDVRTQPPRKVVKPRLSHEESEESDAELSKLRKSPRKGKGVNKKYAKDFVDETTHRLSRHPSKTSVTSLRMTTRSQSVQSVKIASEKSRTNQAGDHELNVDEFFNANCATNDRHLVEDPETIRQMNASSSEDSDVDNNVHKPKDSEKSSNKKILNEEKTPAKNVKELHVSVSRSPDKQQMLQSDSHDNVNKPKDLASKNTEVNKINRAEKTPAKNTKQLHVSVARSPDVERMMQSDSDDNVNKSKDGASKGTEVSQNKLISHAASQNKEIQESANNAEKTPEKSKTKLCASGARTPEIEKLARSAHKEDLRGNSEKSSGKSSPHRSMRANKKRRLYSDKFNDFSGSECETPKQNKAIDKSKRSSEAAQVYLNIEENRKKAIQGSGGRGRPSTKKKKTEQIVDNQIKIVKVPKTLEPSTNANFSYRRCAMENMTEREKRMSDLFDMLKADESQNNNDYYTKFSDDNKSDSERIFKEKKRKITHKKPAPKRVKKTKKGNNKVKEILTSHNYLIDEKVRSVHPKNVVESPKMPAENNASNSPEIIPEVMEMVPPNDHECEDVLIDIEPNIDIELAENEAINNKENVIINETDSNRDENEASQKSGQSGPKFKSTAVKNSGGSTKSHRNKNKASKIKAQRIIPETQSRELDASLPSLIVEPVEEEEEVHNYDLFTGIDINKIRTLVGDMTNTTNESLFDLAAYEKTDDKVVDTVRIQPENQVKKTTNNVVCLNVENSQEHEIESYGIDVHSQPKSVANKPKVFIEKNRDITNLQKDLETVVNEKQRPVNSNKEITFDNRSKTPSAINVLSSPERQCFVALSPFRRESNASVVRDEASIKISDSEDDNRSIILSCRSRRTQASRYSSSSDFNGDMFDLCTTNKSKRPASIIKNNTDAIGSKTLSKISEESERHKSIHSTPKSATSVDYAKYLEAHISPLRFSPSNAKLRKDRQPNKKAYVIEKEDEMIAGTSREQPRKVVSYLSKWKQARNPVSDIGSGTLHGPIGNKSHATTKSYVHAEPTSYTRVEPSENIELVETPPQKRHTSRSSALFTPKPNVEKRYRDIGCKMTTNMDNWLASLNTMGQTMLQFKREIESLKRQLPSDCCVRHRRHNSH